MVMVIILAVGILIVSTTALIGVDDLEIGFSQEAGSHALLAAESCAEEAMLRLSRNSSYSGGTLLVGESTCTIAVTGVPCGACTIDVASTRDYFTRNIQVGVTVSGSSVDITSWAEQD
jgi:hypothetical protein